ncbi:MAG TPA: hypothetical protein PKM73_11590 [Verrucomicrobiota bacterium]|nr:hypothetical protein [Verrucomicrobiota bacterium]HNU51393.1 hypothetical protein [Verrucomicrobiota bacterium]
MNLSEEQRQQVANWLREGLQLPEIQKRLETELGLRLTYMEVKLLVSDLQVLPKDLEPPKPVGPLTPPPGPPPPPRKENRVSPEPQPAPGSGGAGVQVSVDQIAKPGAVLSGAVTFGNGQSALWYLDQAGRIGVAPRDKTYRPSAAEMQEFQLALEQELAKLGY